MCVLCAKQHNRKRMEYAIEASRNERDAEIQLDHINQSPEIVTCSRRRRRRTNKMIHLFLSHSGAGNRKWPFFSLRFLEFNSNATWVCNVSLIYCINFYCSRCIHRHSVCECLCFRSRSDAKRWACLLLLCFAFCFWEFVPKLLVQADADNDVFA